MYGKCSAYLNDTIVSSKRGSTDSWHMTLIKPQPRIELFKGSLVFSGTTCWNKLPKDLKQPLSTPTFKRKLLVYLHSCDSGHTKNYTLLLSTTILKTFMWLSHSKYVISWKAAIHASFFSLKLSEVKGRLMMHLASVGMYSC